MPSTTKFTIEDIRQAFKSKGCILLVNAYENQAQPLPYICSCGEEAVITFKTFQKKPACQGKHNTIITNDYVTAFFIKQGCELLESYKNCMTPMKYRCSCGEISMVRWNDFKDGTRCAKCRVERIVETREINQNHWAITGVYSPPTNQVELTCQQCGKKYSVPKHKEKTSKFCEKECQSKWQETHTIPPKLTDQSLAKMVATKKANGSVKGPNNPNWKGGITAVNPQIRKSDKYKEWCVAVYRKDGWTCVICGKTTSEIKLEAHHRKPFSKIIKDNQIRSLDDAIKCNELWEINNGASFCHECHSELHRNYNIKRKGTKR